MFRPSIRSQGVLRGFSSPGKAQHWKSPQFSALVSVAQRSSNQWYSHQVLFNVKTSKRLFCSSVPSFDPQKDKLLQITTDNKEDHNNTNDRHQQQDSNSGNGDHTTQNGQEGTDPKQSGGNWIVSGGIAMILGLASLLSYLVFTQLSPVWAESDGGSEGEWSEQRLRAMLRRTNSTERGRGKAPIYRIVLTGGPCGGKSTALSIISDRLLSLGFRVFVVPEAATIVITGGGMWKDYREMTPDQALAFEGNLMKTKMALEDAFYSLAEASGEPSVIICDRGTMDTAAYLPPASFDVLMDEFNWNILNLRDRRYDAVIHMVSSAIGAENFYTTENNAARTETIEEARILDFKILNAWVGHPVIRIIDNSTDFKGKIKRVVTQICQIVGAPRPVGVERKFIITDPNVHIPVKYEQFYVEQTYLVKGKGEGTKGYIYVRRRGQNGAYTYSYSVKRDIPGQDKHEAIVERQISGREYVALLKQADPKRATVKKKVKCFTHNNHYFELSQYLEPNTGFTLLETESEDFSEASLPPWIQNSIQKEVTGRKEITSYFLAKLHKNGKVGPLTITTEDEADKNNKEDQKDKKPQKAKLS